MVHQGHLSGKMKPAGATEIRTVACCQRAPDTAVAMWNSERDIASLRRSCHLADSWPFTPLSAVGSARRSVSVSIRRHKFFCLKYVKP